jgi:hypothetical protein
MLGESCDTIASEIGPPSKVPDGGIDRVRLELEKP